MKVVGVEPEAAPTLSMALKAGGPVDAPAGGIAADSPAPRRIGTLVYPIAKQHVDHVVLVPDEVINRARLALWETLRVVAEPGGAAAFAALISGRYEPGTGVHVGILLSGGNTTAVSWKSPNVFWHNSGKADYNREATESTRGKNHAGGWGARRPTQ